MIFDDLAPAPFDSNARGHVHAAWTWVFQFNSLQASASLQHLTVNQLRDVRLAISVFGPMVDAELRRQELAAVAAACLTPDAVVTS